MAIDKAVDSAALEANLTTIANAIREKAGTSDALAFPEGFAEAIAGIEAGGGEEVAYGTITFDADTAADGHGIATGLSADKKFSLAAVFEFSPATSIATNDFLTYVLHLGHYTSSGVGTLGQVSYYGNIKRVRTSATNSTRTADKITIYSASSVMFRSGKTYGWFAWTGGEFSK